MNTRRALFAALILLITALACVIPGTQQPASNPAPTIDIRLDLMVAETVTAAVEQTARAVPTFTATLPPPTITPTSEPIVTSSGILTQNDNGSTLFADESAGYEITIPAGWLAVRVNEQEYTDALGLADPSIQRSLLSIQDQDPATFRLLALDVQEGHIQNEIVTNVNFIWDQQTVMSFDAEDDLQGFADELPSIMDGLTVSSVEIVIPLSGIPYGVIKSEVGGFNASGVQITLFQKMAFFNLKTGTLVVTFTTENGFVETSLPEFDAMLESIAVETE